MIELNETNYEDFISGEKVLVDVWAQWCGPCKIVIPILEEYAFENADKIRIGKLNVDVNQDIVASLQIRNIPTLLLFENGKVIKKHVGVINKTELSDFINNE